MQEAHFGNVCVHVHVGVLYRWSPLREYSNIHVHMYILYSLSLSLCVCRSEEANKSFSAAVQLHDALVKAWGLWGDFLDQLFTEDKYVGRGGDLYYIHTYTVLFSQTNYTIYAVHVHINVNMVKELMKNATQISFALTLHP